VRVLNGFLESAEPPPELLWRSFNGSYITAYGVDPTHRRPHATATEYCTKQGGHLLTVWNISRNNFLKKSFAALLWVGLQCKSSSSCRWSDGKLVQDNSTWLDKEPRVVKRSGHARQCGASLSMVIRKQLDFSLKPVTGLTDSGLLNDAPTEGPSQFLTLSRCDALLGFLCKTGGGWLWSHAA
jgi:hypothetical protein